MSGTTTEQHKQVFHAAESVWQQIGQDVPEDRVTVAEMIETSLDANRLESFGHEEEAELFQTMLLENNLMFSDVIKLLAVYAQFEYYEGGGTEENFY